ncbi:MAG TPA: hypothetical protein VK797_13320 [Tepidisphaeraceae bacterium]|nr:hypothetical protein [Tepidisphaeraceae bacterium]
MASETNQVVANQVVEVPQRPPGSVSHHGEKPKKHPFAPKQHRRAKRQKPANKQPTRSGSEGPPIVRSVLQRAASRVNGAKSHGPTSDVGKKISSHNSLTHGLTTSSASSVSLDENGQEYLNKYIKEFTEEFQPRTPSERILIREAAEQQILLDRISRYQQAVMESIQLNPSTPVFEQIKNSARLLSRVIGELAEGRCIVTAEESEWLCATVANFYQPQSAQTQPAATSIQISSPDSVEWELFRAVLAGKAELPMAMRTAWQIRLQDTLNEYERRLTPAERLQIHQPGEFNTYRFVEGLPVLERIAVYADRRRRVRDRSFDRLREARRFNVELIEPAGAAPTDSGGAALPDQSSRSLTTRIDPGNAAHMSG